VGHPRGRGPASARRPACAARSEKEGLSALVEFHEARVATKMNIAMERLALITAVLLPITAISSVYGMNLIVSDSTRPMHLILVLLGMGVVSGLILRWTRRSGWW